MAIRSPSSGARGAEARSRKPRRPRRSTKDSKARVLATTVELVPSLEPARNKGRPQVLPKGAAPRLAMWCFAIRFSFVCASNTLPFRKHLLEPAGCHTEQQHTGLRPDVLETCGGVLGGTKTKGTRRGAPHNTFAPFLKLNWTRSQT